MAAFFNVYQFFKDESYEQVRAGVSAEEAVTAAMHYATSVGAKLGTTQRVIITDEGDFCNWEWTWEKGLTYGASPEHHGKLRHGVG